jgi:hypothetical protein
MATNSVADAASFDLPFCPEEKAAFKVSVLPIRWRGLWGSQTVPLSL